MSSNPTEAARSSHPIDRTGERQAISGARRLLANVEDHRADLLEFHMHAPAEAINEAGEGEVTIFMRFGPPGSATEHTSERAKNRAATLGAMGAALSSAGHTDAGLKLSDAAEAIVVQEDAFMPKEPIAITDHAAARELLLRPIPGTDPQQYVEVPTDKPVNTPNRLRRFLERGGEFGTPYHLAQIRRTMTKMKQDAPTEARPGADATQT